MLGSNSRMKPEETAVLYIVPSVNHTVLKQSIDARADFRFGRASHLFAQVLSHKLITLRIKNK